MIDDPKLCNDASSEFEMISLHDREEVEGISLELFLSLVCLVRYSIFGHPICVLQVVTQSAIPEKSGGGQI